MKKIHTQGLKNTHTGGGEGWNHPREMSYTTPSNRAMRIIGSIRNKRDIRSHIWLEWQRPVHQLRARLRGRETLPLQLLQCSHVKLAWHVTGSLHTDIMLTIITLAEQ